MIDSGPGATNETLPQADDPPAAPPNPNVILIWMCFLVGINQLGFGSVVPSLPLYAQSFGVTASAIGMAVGIYGLARFFIALPAGRLADALGRRPSLAIGGLISGVGNLWCAWATGYPEFLLARFVAGAGAGLIVTVGHVVLADISTPERRGRMLSIYMGSFVFAVGIGPFPGGLLAEAYGLDAPFIAFGIANILAMLVAWFAVAETRHFGETATSATRGPMPSFSAQIRLLSGQIGFALASLISFMNAAVRTGGLFSIVPIFAASHLGLSVSEIGFALMIGSVSGLLASYPAGAITDHYGRKTVIVPTTLISGLSMALFAVSDTYPIFLAAAILWGIASTVSGSAPTAYAADSAPPGMNAAAIGTYRAAGDAGYVVGPFALGAIVDFYGAWPALIVAAVAMMLAGLAFALFAPETFTRTRSAK
jgi:DHA1 family multidrug resistance protein-like MFS transporter